MLLSSTLRPDKTASLALICTPQHIWICVMRRMCEWAADTLKWIVPALCFNLWTLLCDSPNSRLPIMTFCRPLLEQVSVLSQGRRKGWNQPWGLFRCSINCCRLCISLLLLTRYCRCPAPEFTLHLLISWSQTCLIITNVLFSSNMKSLSVLSEIGLITVIHVLLVTGSL